MISRNGPWRGSATVVVLLFAFGCSGPSKSGDTTSAGEGGTTANTLGGASTAIGGTTATGVGGSTASSIKSNGCGKAAPLSEATQQTTSIEGTARRFAAAGIYNFFMTAR
jgi:hypothetical protein